MSDETRAAPDLAPDLAALGLSRSSVLGALSPSQDTSLGELLLYMVDPGFVVDVDPTDVVLHHAAEWLRLLSIAAHDSDPTLLDLDSRLNDLRREIEVAAELHRRQRAALLEALAAERGAT